jgi:heme-degrading monooxygenase HmoA
MGAVCATRADGDRKREALRAAASLSSLPISTLRSFHPVTGQATPPTTIIERGSLQLVCRRQIPLPAALEETPARCCSWRTGSQPPIGRRGCYPQPRRLAFRRLLFEVWDDCGVITEQAMLDIKPGQEHDFESSFSEAKAIIASMPGFESLQLHRCVEQPTRYLLLVRWQRLEDHTEGFRESPKYEEWRRLLHHYYDPFPTVEHFSLIATA